jgi:ABC-type multidrug transport system ATPase subunit
LDYLLPLADRVILLQDGKLIADGKPRSLLAKMKDVDLPEVSEIHIPGINQQVVELDEAKSLILKKIIVDP